MIFNQKALLDVMPIKDMATSKRQGPGGTSFGLSEAGYDIRIKQSVLFHPTPGGMKNTVYGETRNTTHERYGSFALASAMEEFQMPDFLVAVVHDKSTWARQGLSVFNTVIEPGWKGFLTLELVYHGNEPLSIPAGSGIAQVLFHELVGSASYDGKYQNQPDQPVAAIRRT